jgi:hypothetical protein
MPKAGWPMPPNCWKPSRDNVRNALIGLQEMVKGELTGDDVTVVLLLPTDDAPLADRAAALGQWCQGFLTGFGLNCRGSSMLSTEAKEVLQDLAAISQVQDALEESEDGESDYMEVMEYLRVAPLLLFSETRKPTCRRRQAVAALIACQGKPSAHDPYPKAEYSRRRKALMAQMVPNSIAILPAAAVAIRNRDVEHVYRQDSDFQYLSGFPSPGGDRPDARPRAWRVRAVLPRTQRRARAVGRPARRPGRRDRDFGADDAFPSPTSTTSCRA